MSPPTPTARRLAPALKKKRSVPGALTSMFLRGAAAAELGSSSRTSTRAGSFKKNLQAFVAQHGRVHPARKSRTGIFSLSDVLRLHIWRLVLDDLNLGDKPIRLSHPALYKAVWRDQDFKSLPTILRAMRPYFSVSFGFYADIMTSILFTEYFHVVFSPFLAQKYFGRLAQEWLPKYGHCIQHMIVELDMSRLGFSANSQGLDVASGTMGLQVLMDIFVQSQLKRKNISHMNKLFLLCRRYYGNRGALAKSEKESTQGGNDNVPWCPDSAVRIADPIIQMSGLVDSIRICGFNADYAYFLIRQIFALPDDANVPAEQGFTVSKLSPWPRLKDQTSFIDISKGKNEIVIDKHDLPAPLAEDEKLPVSTFDLDQPEELTLRQRSNSFAARVIQSIRSERKDKVRDRRPSTSGGDKTTVEDHVAHQSASRRRSLSLGQLSHQSTKGQELDRVSSSSTLKKQISNFTLRSKASKKSLKGSFDQDAETLIPDLPDIPPVPPIPQKYQDAGYSRTDLTETSSKYGPAVKASKTEVRGLLERPVTPAPPSIPNEADKKPVKKPSKLNLFKKFSNSRLKAPDAVEEPKKVPAKQFTSQIPMTTASTLSVPAKYNAGIDQKKTQEPAQRPVETAHTAERKKPTNLQPGRKIEPKYSLFPKTTQTRPLGVGPRDNLTPESRLSPKTVQRRLGVPVKKVSNNSLSGRAEQSRVPERQFTRPPGRQFQGTTSPRPQLTTATGRSSPQVTETTPKRDRLAVTSPSQSKPAGLVQNTKTAQQAQQNLALPRLRRQTRTIAGMSYTSPTPRPLTSPRIRAEQSTASTTTTGHMSDISPPAQRLQDRPFKQTLPTPGHTKASNSYQRENTQSPSGIPPPGSFTRASTEPRQPRTGPTTPQLHSSRITRSRLPAAEDTESQELPRFPTPTPVRRLPVATQSPAIPRQGTSRPASPFPASLQPTRLPQLRNVGSERNLSSRARTSAVPTQASQLRGPNSGRRLGQLPQPCSDPPAFSHGLRIQRTRPSQKPSMTSLQQGNIVDDREQVEKEEDYGFF